MIRSRRRPHAGLTAPIVRDARRWLAATLALFAAPLARAQDAPATSGARVSDGLLALYDFADSDGRTVHDRSGVGDELPLEISEPRHVRRTAHALEVTEPTRIVSSKPAHKVTRAVRKSRAVTIEAWVRSSRAQQSGPARVVSLSENTTRRNFTLGQDGDRWDVRLRADSTDANGLPSTQTPRGAVTRELTHLVYTRSRGGEARLFVDGRVAAERDVRGDLDDWRDDYRLSLANEVSGDRAWLGELHLVAIYGRALSSEEVALNFAAGSGADSGRTAPTTPPSVEVTRPREPTSPTEATTTLTAAGRVTRGLRNLYTFEAGLGNAVLDRAGVGTALHLEIEHPGRTRWGEHGLEIRQSTRLLSSEPASKISIAARRNRELSIEAWLRTADEGQTGPARIVTLSPSPSERNLTLGQDGDHWDVRLRTSETSTNGNPSLAAPKGTAKKTLTHVVYTRAADGTARLWVDGEKSAEGEIGGDLDGWSDEYQLILANELTSDRPWLGELRLVAVYARALTAEEVARNFAAGSDVRVGEPLATRLARALEAETKDADDPTSDDAPATDALPADQPVVFAQHVAPLLEKHCLECHGPSKKKGRLDLSLRDAALAGGRKGALFEPGAPAESLLWELVAEDDMPKSRPPLSTHEKDILRRWIEEGASWPEEIASLSRLDGDAPIERHHEFACSSEAIDPGPLLLRRLTVPEYIETVRSAVGVDVEQDALDLLPADLRADGFSNTAYNLGVDLEHMEAFRELAARIVERMEPVAFARRFSACESVADVCMSDLVAAMGKWLLRGPLSDAEVLSYLRISHAVADAGGDFSEAIGYVIEAMLQSPRFLYLVEDHAGDGSTRDLRGHEIACRMSYILWGAPPDAELFAAAERGELASPESARAQAERMLADPRARERSARFFSEWLALSRLDHLAPSREHFPDWDPALADDMRAESLAYFDHVVWEERRPLRDLMNAQVTFLTPRLAKHYGLSVEDGESAEGATTLARYDLADVPERGGILTHASVLTVGGDDASTVTRGLFVLHDLLASGVEDPPPGVDTTPVPSKPGLSKRGIAEDRLANEACGGCHAKFEPLSFAFEKYDGIGAFHDIDEHGNELREDGEILFPGREEAVPFTTTRELLDLLAKSDRVAECLTLQVVQFALGRPLVASDSCALREIHDATRAGGGTWGSLITAVVTSDLIRKTRTETTP